MNKSHSLVKKLKKEVIFEAVEETTQVESSVQKLKELVGGEKKKIDEDSQLEISEGLKEVYEIVLQQPEEKESVKLDLDINDIQGNMIEVSIPSKMESKDIQVPSEKTKGNSMVGFKKEGVLISTVKFWGKSYAMLGESNWRPKTRPKNKLILNMKKLLNPKLDKEKIIVIDSEDSSS